MYYFVIKILLNKMSLPTEVDCIYMENVSTQFLKVITFQQALL